MASRRKFRESLLRDFRGLVVMGISVKVVIRLDYIMVIAWPARTNKQATGLYIQAMGSVELLHMFRDIVRKRRPTWLRETEVHTNA